MAYTSPYGTGDRRSVITATVSGLTFGAGNVTNLIDGVTNAGPYTSHANITGDWLKWDFTASIILTEITFKKQNWASSVYGTWQAQGSHNDSSWDNIGSAFAIDNGTAGVSVLTALSGNTTAYRYYRLLGVSGAWAQTSDIFEFEFSWTYPVPRDIKTIDGVAYADIKSVDSILIADVKNFNTVS
ncbi:MAG: hypothetical protein AAB116_16400 [Candidatus Poribacteria bacterium]